VFAGVQEKLGILNGGVVYAVYDYEAHNSDELSFKEGDKLIVLRKGDEWEREWWWSRLSDQEGYIPRNLLGVCAFESSGSVKCVVCYCILLF
jgi:apoptosis-stimulating of p53 protein 1